MDSLCCVRNKIMHVLPWRTVSVLTPGLFWWLFPSLLRNFENKHQKNPFVCTETVRHSSTYIILCHKKMAKPSISEINILWWCCWNWSNIMLSHFADYLNFMCLHSQLSNWHPLILPVLEVINRFNITSPCQNWHWDNLIIAPLPLGKHWKIWVITKSTKNLIIQLQQNKA